MRCPGCGADVSALREFCPKCGTSTDSAIRDRRFPAPGSRPDEELKSNRVKVLVIAAAIMLLAGVAGRLSWPGIPLHFSTHAPSTKGPLVTDAEQIYRAYHADPDGAAKRFGGRELQVSGEFLRIVPDGWGSIDMRLKTSNPDSPLGADLVSSAIEDAKQLRPGEKVTVSCRQMAGAGDDRWLQECAIQPEDGAGAAPSPPPPPAPPPAPEANSG
jgi:hypothetical protein